MEIPSVVFATEEVKKTKTTTTKKTTQNQQQTNKKPEKNKKANIFRWKEWVEIWENKKVCEKYFVHFFCGPLPCLPRLQIRS